MKWQREELELVLKENNFDAGEFEHAASTAQSMSHESGEQLRLRGTDYFFGIYTNQSEYFDENKFFVEYSPGEEKLTELKLCGDWRLVTYAFAGYLSFLRREMSATDPWTEEGVVRVTKHRKDQTLIPAGNLFTGQRLAKAILSEATESLDILDPYIGTELLDRIDDAGIKVPIRILTTAKSNVSPSYFKAFQQRYIKAELRIFQASKLHDRFILINKTSGYHLGHSLKDLGKKDTQISPIHKIQPQLALFEERWSEAKEA